MNLLSDMLSPMWSIRPVVESSMHIPDIKADNFHCLAKTGFESPPPEHYVKTGVPHPTIQFTHLDFFKYPFVHVKAQWADRAEGNYDVIWDAIYRTPMKASLSNFKPGSGIEIGKLGWKAELVRNILKPGGANWVHMKKICVPPDNAKHRLLVTVTPTDSNQNDVLNGPSGLGVYSVKHSFGNKHYLHQLNKGISFL
jgi:hypothetical protein